MSEVERRPTVHNPEVLIGAENLPTQEVLDNGLASAVYLLKSEQVEGCVFSPKIGDRDVSGKLTLTSFFEGTSEDEQDFLTGKNGHYDQVMKAVDHYHHATIAAEKGKYDPVTGKYSYHDEETNQDYSGTLKVDYLVAGLEEVADLSENEENKTQARDLLDRVLVPSLTKFEKRVSPDSKQTEELAGITFTNSQNGEQKLLSYGEWQVLIEKKAEELFENYGLLDENTALKRIRRLQAEEALRGEGTVSFTCHSVKEKPPEPAEEPSPEKPKAKLETPENLAGEEAKNLGEEVDAYLKETAKERTGKLFETAKEEKRKLNDREQAQFEQAVGLAQATLAEIKENDSQVVADFRLSTKLDQLYQLREELNQKAQSKDKKESSRAKAELTKLNVLIESTESQLDLENRAQAEIEADFLQSVFKEKLTEEEVALVREGKVKLSKLVGLEVLQADQDKLEQEKNEFLTNNFEVDDENIEHARSLFNKIVLNGENRTRINNIYFGVKTSKELQGKVSALFAEIMGGEKKKKSLLAAIPESVWQSFWGNKLFILFVLFTLQGMVASSLAQEIQQ